MAQGAAELVANEIDSVFASARQSDRPLLIPYLSAGFPDRTSFVELANRIFDAGADMLEIGMPFSDPLLDGPSIQNSQQKALENGTTIADCLDFASRIHDQVRRPLLLMGAFNPLLGYGLDAFCGEANRAGVCGLIIPDLPLEEQAELRECATAQRLHLIQMIAPSSPAARVSQIARHSSGFIYAVSVSGVTGVRSDVSSSAGKLVDRIHAQTDLPVAVGFGIKGPSEAATVGRFADGVIVGSALIDCLMQADPANRLEVAAAFIRALRRSLDAARSS